MKNLILICGDEEYLKEQKKNELLERLTVPGSMNFNAFTGENADPDEIGRLAETMPFLEDHRTILISDTGWFKGASDEAVLAMVSQVPDSAYMIFFEKETDGNSRLQRLLKEKGEIFRFTSAESMKGREASAARQDIRNWAGNYLKKNKRNIDGRVLNDLVEMTGYDMQNLQTELEKLISFTIDRPAGAPVTKEDVDRICSRTLNDRVFEMMNYDFSVFRIYDPIFPGVCLTVLAQLQNHILTAGRRRQYFDNEIRRTFIAAHAEIKILAEHHQIRLHHRIIITIQPDIKRCK